MPKPEQKKEKTYLADDCDKVGETAIHYGFTVIKPPHITPTTVAEAKGFKEFDYYQDIDEKIALCRWYEENAMGAGPQPAMIHFKKPLPGSALKKKPSEEIYGFEIMGSAKAESEAVLLKTALAALTELGYHNLCVDIHSIGDKESISRFERELSNYFRKHGHSLPAKARQEFKKNHYSILSDTSEETAEFRHGAPQSIGTLSDASRIHFKEVLEYLEMFGEAYKIHPTLWSNKQYASHTVFEIRQMPQTTVTKPSKATTDNGSLLAYGYRYNYLVKKIGGKKDIPMIGMTLTVSKSKIPAKKISIKNIKKPRFYLVQLGNTAKLKALNVVEMLRTEKIPVFHSVTKDKITGQLSGAEYMRASHVLIIGQKEAIENSIVVRHVITREQETVTLKDLPDFLRKIK